MHSLPGKYYDTLPASNENLVGQRKHLTKGDIEQILDMYQCKKKAMVKCTNQYECTWRATGCPNMPSQAWTGWHWYFSQRSSPTTVFNDMQTWCTSTAQNHKDQCCGSGISCTPTCTKQTGWVQAEPDAVMIA